MNDTNGPLIVIGGHEEKEGKRSILKAVAEEAHGGKLVIATVASHQPEGYFDSYRKAFEGLGIGELVELYLDTREETFDDEKLSVLDGAAGVFFSGGDQLRLSSQIGDTPIETRIREIWSTGGVIAGTSAGASVMSETMLVRGASSESHRIGDLRLAAGLGLIRDAVIDQHFAERGRIGRLLGAVAQNPRILGIGIDENTAIRVVADSFDVLGSGAVYVVDGEQVTQSNISEARNDSALSLFGARLHVLSSGDSFDLARRLPLAAKSQ
jgi:cyanophycinase